MIIGERLKAVRESKNMSQGYIESKTGLLRCYVSRVENGHTVPSIDTLEQWTRALVSAKPRRDVPKGNMKTYPLQLVLADLMFLRDAGVVIDDETFTSVLRYENMHRDFASCSDCGVTTFSQHDSLCRYASVLWLPEWFESVQARDRNR